VQPAVTSVIYKLVDPHGTSLIDLRDRALILLGFAGAFRRSELAQLLLTDITETEDGLRVRLIPTPFLCGKIKETTRKDDVEGNEDHTWDIESHERPHICRWMRSRNA